MIWNGLLGARVYRWPVTGLFHGLVFWGMLLLLIGTALVLLNVVSGLAVMSGPFYQWFMAFTLDAAGLAVLVGLGFLLVRRLMHYPRLSRPKSRPGFLLAEIFLVVVVLTGFVLEGQRLNLSGGQENAFVGNLITMALQGMGSGEGFYIIVWWLHGLLALAFIAWIPFSPLAHLLFIPVNAAMAEPIMGADEKALDVATLEPDAHGSLPTLGTPTLADYSAKRLLDFSTCLWCGRCQEVCPATLTEKTLTPKGVVITLAEALNQGSDERPQYCRQGRHADIVRVPHLRGLRRNLSGYDQPVESHLGDAAESDDGARRDAGPHAACLPQHGSPDAPFFFPGVALGLAQRTGCTHLQSRRNRIPALDRVCRHL